MAPGKPEQAVVVFPRLKDVLRLGEGSRLLQPLEPGTCALPPDNSTPTPGKWSDLRKEW